ncbi:MAG: peptide-methionine (S)-S-oxide reductase MsrA [Bacteroidia bacterium]|nr:peptide-methionine (S)-S-oxide reductase MsrA [Bacteroidia bacterium]MDW8347979.1 peptide-methionine (S)-S-oxide reductase MsrA [Bacteroidia bacterium]
MNTVVSPNAQTATLAGGCFWCIEAIYLEVEGVERVVSGYTGGHKPNPTYEQVCSGNTGHAEAVEIKFNPDKISYKEILEIFFTIHDPTTLNRQGNDIGTQYRSAIFYHTPEQKAIAETVIKEAQNQWQNPIVTELVPAQTFYKAEDYHQNYYNLHPNQGYCAVVISPKIAKFRKTFKDKLKKS